MSAVERAARAMREKDPVGCWSLNDEDLCDLARAAIASLRVPTPEMRRTVLVLKVDIGMWERAIDAALSEPRIESGSAPGEGGE